MSSPSPTPSSMIDPSVRTWAYCIPGCGQPRLESGHVTSTADSASMSAGSIANRAARSSVAWSMKGRRPSSMSPRSYTLVSLPSGGASLVVVAGVVGPESGGAATVVTESDDESDDACGAGSASLLQPTTAEASINADTAA